MSYVSRILLGATRRMIPGRSVLAYSSDAPTPTDKTKVSTTSDDETVPTVGLSENNSVKFHYVEPPLTSPDPSKYVTPDPGYTGTEEDALLYPMTASNLGDKFDPFFLGLEDPHFGKVYSNYETHPNTLGESVGNMRIELLGNILGNDDPFEFMAKPINTHSTREDPQLVMCDWRYQHRLFGCICHKELNHVHWMRLKRNIPTRCKCGHWYKLVQYAIYAKHIENYRIAQWRKIKDNPDWVNYMKEREKAKKEMIKIIAKIEQVEQYSNEERLLHDDLLDVEKRIMKLRDEMENKYFPDYKQCIM